MATDTPGKVVDGMQQLQKQLGVMQERLDYARGYMSCGTEDRKAADACYDKLEEAYMTLAQFS